MKKILSCEEATLLDQKAEARGETTETLMEQAGKQIALFLDEYVQKKSLKKQVVIFAGKGNNAGDGYVAGVHLLKRGFQVFAYSVLDPEIDSLCAKQKKRFESEHGVLLSAFPTLTKDTIILDAIFGIGFKGKTEGEAAKAIHKINSSPVLCFSIDIPSGLNGNIGHMGDAHASPCIVADYTLAIEAPKLGFFVGLGWNFVGKIITLPIGLNAHSLTTELEYLEEEDVANFLPSLIRARHKYEAGHVVGLAGGPGMCGAAMLAAQSCLKAGAGIVHLLHPSSLSHDLAGPPWEIIRLAYPQHNLPFVRGWLARAKARFVGPGMGQSRDAEFVLKNLWNEYKHNAVLDADCLNFLARTQTPIGPLPNSILTPHVGEMHRLLDEQISEPITLSFLRRCQRFTETNLTHVVLKGGPSFLFSLGMPISVMPRGDPGMATAGSGDVLTGILAALLAQGLTAHEALFLGTYLHGLAGEKAALDETSYSMTASSIIQALPHAFKELEAFQGHSPKHIEGAFLQE